MTHSMKRAEQIYEAAMRRSREDHNAMVDDFVAGKILFCPSGMDRDRLYIIQDFAEEIERLREILGLKT